MPRLTRLRPPSEPPPTSCSIFKDSFSTSSHLAGCARRNVLALGGGLASGDGNARPGPARAGSAPAQDVDVGGGAADAAGDLADGEAGDGNSGGGCASWAAVLVTERLLVFDLSKGRYQTNLGITYSCSITIPYLVMPDKVMSL